MILGNALYLRVVVLYEVLGRLDCVFIFKTEIAIDGEDDVENINVFPGFFPPSDVID